MFNTKCDRVSRTFNLIYSSIFNTQDSQQTYICISCGARMSDNDQKQQRDKTHWGKQHQSLAKPDKMRFLNEPKHTEQAEHTCIHFKRVTT